MTLPRRRDSHAAAGRVLVGCDGCGAIGIAGGRFDPVVPIAIFCPPRIGLVHTPDCEDGIVWTGEASALLEWVRR